MAFDNGRGAVATVLTQFAENNAWSNYRTYAACAALGDDAYFAPRPSFFGSIHATLDHILIVDLLYIGRIQGVARIANDAEQVHDDRHVLREAQAETDRELVALCRELRDEALKRQVGYTRHDVTACDESVANLLKHLFVHQVHHRGQVHGLLSATSVEPPQLDEFFLDSDRPLREEELQALGL